MDTDTDAAFAGEANIDGKNPNTKATLRGEENVLVARGGVDAHLAADEDDPLLPASSDSPDNDRGSGHEWSAHTESDDKPWYKRPSVG